MMCASNVGILLRGEEAADILPTCGGCFIDRSKPKVFKHKRNQMQLASKKKQKSTH